MTTAVATLDRNFAGSTTATPAIRELTMEELDWVAGGDLGETVVTTAWGVVGGFVGDAYAPLVAARLGLALGAAAGPVGAFVGAVAFAAAGYLLYHALSD